jgi:hypothetical protein
LQKSDVEIQLEPKTSMPSLRELFTISAVSSIISGSGMPGTILSKRKAMDYLSSAPLINPCNFEGFS